MGSPAAGESAVRRARARAAAARGQAATVQGIPAEHSEGSGGAGAGCGSAGKMAAARAAAGAGSAGSAAGGECEPAARGAGLPSHPRGLTGSAPPRGTRSVGFPSVVLLLPLPGPRRGGPGRPLLRAALSPC